MDQQPKVSSTRLRRATAMALVPPVLGLGIVGCGGGPEATDSPTQASTPRNLTTEESQTLAISRFLNYERGVRRVDATIPEGPDTWRLLGWFDYRAGRGYATLWRQGDQTSSALLLWSGNYLLSHLGAATPAGELPPTNIPGTPSFPPAEGSSWLSTTYAPAEYAPHAALRIIASLGSDRPENPLLLKQSSAHWVRTKELRGVEVDVIAGPQPAKAGTSNAASPGDATVRYWLDSDGQMHRVEMRLGPTWGTVDLSDPGDETVQIPDPVA